MNENENESAEGGETSIPEENGRDWIERTKKGLKNAALDLFTSGGSENDDFTTPVKGLGLGTLALSADMLTKHADIDSAMISGLGLLLIGIGTMVSHDNRKYEERKRERENRFGGKDE
ncbi:MAG: hypothetical protein WC451_01250 [Patescibacteria group bacterium]